VGLVHTKRTGTLHLGKSEGQGGKNTEEKKKSQRRERPREVHVRGAAKRARDSEVKE